MFKTTRLFVTGTVCISCMYYAIRDARFNKLYSSSSCRSALRSLSLPRRFNSPLRTIPESSEDSKASKVRYRQSRLLNLDRLMLFYIKAMRYVHFCVLFKCILVCLLDNKLLYPIRWLDCYLFGRVSMGARLTKESKYFAVYVTGLIVVWLTITRIKCKMKLDIVEFLLMDSSSSQEQNDCKSAGSRKVYESLLYIRTETKSGETKFTLRPTRTNEARKYFEKVTVNFCLIGGFLMLVWSLILIYLNVTLVVTRQGFQLNYCNCLGWINNQPNKSDFEHICWFCNSTDFHRSWPDSPVIPLQDLVPFSSWYQKIRVLVDFLDPTLVWSTLQSQMFGSIYILFILVADIWLYCSKLRFRLKLMDVELARLESGCINEQKKHFADEDSIRELQSMLLDYFGIIDRYNRFASVFAVYFFLILSTFWFMLYYLSHWFREIETLPEWRMIELGNFLAFFSISICLSTVKMMSLSLYPLIANVAAKETRDASVRKNWTAILNFYYPKPNYCFRVHNQEISWMFSLKVSFR